MIRKYTMPTQTKPKSYEQWCLHMERRYDTMPLWYWSPTARLEQYHVYYEATKGPQAWSAGAGAAAVPAEDVQDQGQAHPAQGETQGDN